MSALARIRKTALQHEQERQYDKALALYARLLDGAEAGDEELDVSLFNRAGDLALRVGDTPRALGYFERALDLYAAGGLLNNAVALGVKILRHAPAHLSAHYTLGVLYGRKGFVGDSRHHLLTYAVQMQRAGRADEAARVLAEVAAGCADAGERRAALDAYGALGGDPNQATSLAAEPSAVPGAQVPTPAAEPVTWGAVDFEPVVPVAVEAAPEHVGVEHVGVEPIGIAPIDVEPVAIGAVPFEPVSGELAVVELPSVDPRAGTTAEDVAAQVAPTPDWEAIEFESAADGVVPADLATAGWAEAPALVPAGPEWDEGAFALDDFAPTPEPTAPSAPLVFLDVDPALDGLAEPLPARGGLLVGAVADEPPPLRLAELLRLDPVPLATTASGPVTGARPDAGYADALDVALELPDLALPGLELPGLDVAAAEAPVVEVPVVGIPAVAVAAFAMPSVEALTRHEPAFQEPALDEPAFEEPALDEPASEPPAAIAVSPAADVATEHLPAARTDEMLDLGEWLRATDVPASTRLTTASVPQTGDEQADFDATLRTFTAGVSRAVAHEDWDSHYDLGVAFREMGLLDEAIVQFQRAAQAPGRPLRALEALAQCFLDAGQPELALSTLEGPAAAASAGGLGDAALLAVHYLMGAAAQALGRPDDARRFLVRAVATDVRFRDAAQRLAALPPPSPVR